MNALRTDILPKLIILCHNLSSWCENLSLKNQLSCNRDAFYCVRWKYFAHHRFPLAKSYAKFLPSNLKIIYVVEH